MGSDLLFQGKLLYRDFFFPQMPLSALIFGMWRYAFGYSFLTARFLGALLTATTGLMIFHVVRRETGMFTGLISVLFFSGSRHVMNWLPSSKTYGICSVLGLAALILSSHRTINTKRAFLAGTAAGLCVSTRLMFAPFAVLIVAAIAARCHAPRSLLRLTKPALVGVCIGLIPSVVFLLPAPAAFVFDNWTYHSLRNQSHEMVGDWDQKFVVLQAVFGGQSPAGAQFLLLVPLTLAGLFEFWRRQSRLIVFPLTLVILSVVSLLPTPTWDQYFVTLVPAAIVSASLLITHKLGPSYAIQLSLLIPYAFVFWLWVEPNVVKARPPTGVDVEGAIGHVVQCVTRPGDAVASRVPAYLVASGRDYSLCSFNIFSYGDWSKVPAAKIEQFHLCTDEIFKKEVFGGAVKAVALSPSNELGLAENLAALGWKSISQPPATIWVAPKHE
jgi:hypothetical protein